MANAKEKVFGRLGSAVVHMQTADGKQNVYEVPQGHKAVIMAVIIHSPTESLAGGTDFDIGSGANADTWLQTNDLSAMTATTDYKVITSTAKYTLEVAGAEIGIKPITGSTADADATVEIWGALMPV